MKLELPGIMICELCHDTNTILVSPAEGWKVNVNYPISEAHASMVTMEKMEGNGDELIGKWVKCISGGLRFTLGKWYKCFGNPNEAWAFIDDDGDKSGFRWCNNEIFNLADPRDYNPDERKPHQLKEYDAVECTPEERAEIIRIADECGLDLKYTRIKAFGKSYPNLRFETGDITGIVSRGKCDPKTNWISVPDFIAKIRGEYKENKVNVSEHKHPQL